MMANTYNLVRQIIYSRLCSICKNASSDKWNIEQNLIKGMGSSCSATDVRTDDWLYVNDAAIMHCIWCQEH